LAGSQNYYIPIDYVFSNIVSKLFQIINLGQKNDNGST